MNEAHHRSIVATSFYHFSFSHVECSASRDARVHAVLHRCCYYRCSETAKSDSLSSMMTYGWFAVCAGHYALVFNFILVSDGTRFKAYSHGMDFRSED